MNIRSKCNSAGLQLATHYPKGSLIKSDQTSKVYLVGETVIVDIKTGLELSKPHTGRSLFSNVEHELILK